MVDPFKLPASTAYSPRQPFTFTPAYLKGYCSIRQVDVINKPVTGESGILNVQKSEKIHKGGFSEGTTLKQAPLFPEPRPATIRPKQSLRKTPPKTPKRNYPPNNSGYHYNQNV